MLFYGVYFCWFYYNKQANNTVSKLMDKIIKSAWCEYHFLITRGLILCEGFLMYKYERHLNYFNIFFSIEICFTNLVCDPLICHKPAELLQRISQLLCFLEHLLLTLLRDRILVYVEFRSSLLHFLSSSASGCLWLYLLGHSQ